MKEMTYTRIPVGETVRYYDAANPARNMLCTVLPLDEETVATFDGDTDGIYLLAVNVREPYEDPIIVAAGCEIEYPVKIK